MHAACFELILHMGNSDFSPAYGAIVFLTYFVDEFLVGLAWGFFSLKVFYVFPFGFTVFFVLASLL
jgi:hypothetical protein